MKIEKVEWFLLKVPLNRPVLSSLGVIGFRQVLLVHIACENGIDGWGEAYMNFPLWGSQDRVNFLKYEILPRIIGMPVHCGISNSVRQSLALTGIQWGAIGLVNQVLSAVDTAVWDILAKSKGLPLWKLLGGENKDSIAVYASGIDQQDLEENLEKLVDQGYTSFKIRVGFGKDNDQKAIKCAREIIGDKSLLMVDANQKWSLEEAIEMIKCLQPYGLEWVEEPIRADDLEGLGQIAKAFPDIKIAAGENVYGARDFSTLCSSIAIIQPDITKQGGFTGLNSIGQIAENKGCHLIPHFYGSAVGLAASVHFIASLNDEDGPPLELDSFPNPMIDELVEEFPKISKGRIEVPKGPGLGVAPRGDFINHHLVATDQG